MILGWAGVEVLFLCLIKVLFGNGTAAGGSLQAFLFLAGLNGSGSVEDEDGETVIGVTAGEVTTRDDAAGETVTGEEVVGEELYCV
jgi:hypothetical protein